MSSSDARLYGPLAGGHPAVLNRRLRQLVLAGLAGLVSLVLALGLAIEMPKPDTVVILLLMLATLGVIALVVSTRYQVTVALVVLYLGLLDGPVKLMSANQGASVVRDLFIYAVALGMLMRALVRPEPIKLAPLSGWVLAFVAVVLVQGVNPSTGGVLKALGGFRQQLEWVPLFFFAYMLIRSKERLRQLFIILGVIALANGLVSAYQSRLSPHQLASWGPGYAERIENPADKAGGRTFHSEGIARVRPPALGSDEGGGGSFGVIALPGLLALLASSGLRGGVSRGWVVLMLAGALLGVATAASRTTTSVTFLVLFAYALLSVFAGGRVGRSLVVILVMAAVGVGVVIAVTALDGAGVFSRQETLSSAEHIEKTGGSGRLITLGALPHDLSGAPFGVGLATEGAAAGFGGHHKVTIEGHGTSGENAYDLIALETGLPGFLLWAGFSLNVIILALVWLRRVEDVELRIYLTAVTTSFLIITAMGLVGPTVAVTIGGYLWATAGIIAYWFGGPRRTPQGTIRACPS